VSILLNGHRLRFYHKPISKYEFIEDVLQKNDMEVVSEEGNIPIPTPS